MLSAATALVCALSALNRSEASLPRIVIMESAPSYVSVGTEAFANRDTKTIHVIASAAVVRDAAGRHQGECGDPDAVKKLASILVHEEWHILHGPDEEGAYQRQLIQLLLLGSPAGSRAFREVQLAMQTVVAARKRNRPELVVAGR